MDGAARGERTLVISTDPAPSLGDALGIRLTGLPRSVPLPRGTLHALEISPRQALERWLRPRRRILEAIAVRGTWLDESDVRELLRRSLPGIDELAALLEMLRHGRSPEYDVIVIDTAPTGHTLRMLATPSVLRGVARVFDHMQAKHRAIVEALRGMAIADEADAVVRELEQDAQALAHLLRNPRTTDVCLVALPERLAVEETLDAARSLLEWQIPIGQVIVNRVTARPPQRCGWCEARRLIEREAVSSLCEGIQSLVRDFDRSMPRVALVGARTIEPVGARTLRRVAVELRKPASLPRRVRTKKDPRFRVARVPTSYRQDARLPPVTLVMFGGKGGVGKTTCAAAWALHLARSQPRRRFLLVSTDPAHSLADVLRVPLSDTARPLAKFRNLDVRELDAARALRAIRARYASSVDSMFDRLVQWSPVEVNHDRIVVHDLLDLAPPGLDELAAVLGLVDLLGDGESAPKYDGIVMDTAPTGHALRLLQMPVMVQEWTRTLMRILLKYQPVSGIGELGPALVGLSRGLGRLRALLADPIEAQLVVVTRAAALPRAETARLLRGLHRLRIRVPAVVVNAVGAGVCTRCRADVRRELRELDALLRLTRRGSGRAPLIAAPASLPPPAGTRALEAWRGQWRAR